MEEEHQRKIGGFKKMIQDLAWQLQEEDFKRSKTILWSSVQMEETKKASLEGLEASKTKEGGISESYRRQYVPPYHHRLASGYKGSLKKSTYSGRNFYCVIQGKELLESSNSRVQVLLEVWRIGETFASLVDSPVFIQEGFKYSNHVCMEEQPRREEMLTVESTIVVLTSLHEDKMALCYVGNRIEAENGIAYRPLERVPRKETRNERNYANMDERLKQAPRLCNHNLEYLPSLYGKFVPTYYLEWESEMEHLFDAYNVNEDDKAILASCSFSLSILEYILAYRRRKGVGFNT
ncbi:hypothetical protein M9H77_26670 [Catharanthus roseus]|uniref:Uncharacterized protein n=1 Tax=Catharanthus roseus TaxID=4058 RepID=A0ACC0ABQ9_CATRO|nr:hypothetical protein M9H77_26670 [Catharanthus roseus]